MDVDNRDSGSRPTAFGVEHLAEQLLDISARHDGLNVHLLVQSSDRPDESDAQFAQLLDQCDVRLVPVRINRVPESLWPKLLRLDLARSDGSLISRCALDMALSDRAAQALRHGRIQRSCAWIFSTQSTASLEASIAKRSVITTAATAPHHHWVRYYDPLITDLFWQACDAQARQHMLEKIAAWTFVDRWGQLKMLTPPLENMGEQERPSAPDLNGIGSLNQAWIRARTEARVVAPDQFFATLSTVQRGWKIGIRDRLDLDLFAWHALSLGADFDRHPLIEEILRKVAAGGLYAELAHALDTDAWRRIEKESQPSRFARSQERTML